MQVRIWLFSLSYTLLFAVILSKTWRVYYIFNNTATNKLLVRWILHAQRGVINSVYVVDFLVYQGLDVVCNSGCGCECGCPHSLGGNSSPSSQTHRNIDRRCGASVISRCENILNSQNHE